MSAHRSIAVVVLSVAAPADLRGAVRSLIDQRPQPAEIVVCNSGGGDAVERVRGLLAPSAVINRRVLLRHGAARNAGIAATRSARVGFLSADCRALPGWVAGRTEWHDQGHRVVASAVVNRYPRSLPAAAAHTALFSRRMPGTPAADLLFFGCSYDRVVFDEIGYFREDLDGNEDGDFNDRLRAAGIPVHFGCDILTAHPHPTRLSHLLRDQYRRGRRMAAYRRDEWQLPPGAVARDAVARMGSDVIRAWRSAGPADRGSVRRSVPLVPAAAAAYAAGALTTARTPATATAGSSR